MSDSPESESKLKNRPGDQPLPIPGRECVQDAVIADMIERKLIGTERYGRPLETHNGRDVLQDLYEELLDGAMYAKQEILERQDRRQEAEFWHAASDRNGELYSGAENQRDAAREELAQTKAAIARVQALAGLARVPLGVEATERERGFDVAMEIIRRAAALTPTTEKDRLEDAFAIETIRSILYTTDDEETTHRQQAAQINERVVQPRSRVVVSLLQSLNHVWNALEGKNALQLTIDTQRATLARVEQALEMGSFNPEPSSQIEHGFIAATEVVRLALHPRPEAVSGGWENRARATVHDVLSGTGPHTTDEWAQLVSDRAVAPLVYLMEAMYSQLRDAWAASGTGPFCCVCGKAGIAYENFLEQLFCGACADGQPPSYPFLASS